MAFTPAQLKARGICVKCHKRPSSHGVLCDDCYRRNRERNRLRQQPDHCRQCACKLNEYDRMTGRACARCSETTLNQLRRARARL